MKNFFLLITFCIGSLTSQGDSAEHKWKNYINRQEVYCLFTDNEYLWIGTHNAGLVRRNCTTGEETVFDKDEGFFSDRIISVVKDSNNVLWAASPTNIARYSNNSWAVENLFDNNVKGLTVDAAGALWVACSNGIGRYTGTGFEKITAFDSLKSTNEYPSVLISASDDSLIYALANNRVFVFSNRGTYSRTIDIPFTTPLDICVNNENGLFVAGVDTVGLFKNDQWRFFSRADSSISVPVLHVSVSRQGDVWAYGGGDVSVFNENKWELRHKHEYGNGIVNVVAPLSKDSAWLGRTFFLALKTPDTINVVPSGTPGGNDIKFVFADSEGTIWTQAANDVGIMRFINGKWVFEEAPFYSLYNKAIKMIQTADSTYWFLQSRNCSSYFQKLNGVRQPYVIGSGFVPSGSLNDFIEDATGALWFATSEGVISNRSKVLYGKDNAGFSSNTMNALLLRKDSTVWVGGNDGTLAYFKDSTWALQTISIKSSLTCLAEDSTGNLWIGTKNGVIKEKDGRDTVYTISDGLGSNIVTAVFVDKNNNVWVGTYNGLTCFENGVFKQTYLRPCGIAGNFITSICQNIDGVLWIGTNRGISTLTIGNTAVKKRVLLEQKRSKAGTHKIITLGKLSKAGPETAGAFLLNGKKGTLAIKKNRSRTVNCYIVTE